MRTASLTHSLPRINQKHAPANAGNAYFHNQSGELRLSGVYLKNVRVVSTFGHLVLDEKVNKSKSFNLNRIQRGLYIVVIDTEEKRFFKKFFKN